MSTPTPPVVVLAHSPNQSAGAAFEAAVRQAGWRGARLVILNASTGESLVDPHHARPSDLADMTGRAGEAGVDAVVEQPIGPDVATIILDRADALGAELIVLATRHRSSIGKLIMGSTAQRVLMEADAEVLLVKDTDR
ncbi:universal stress protein [Ornithinimicrobium cavernae]|uniref:universal stress protein n=1 Tax=Ornithinimicrobium cavernae TaxID=2666047 RepID=UPI000D694451|nr:universal stress protein [Ornithinimicrobium cavernae]